MKLEPGILVKLVGFDESWNMNGYHAHVLKVDEAMGTAKVEFDVEPTSHPSIPLWFEQWHFEPIFGGRSVESSEAPESKTFRARS